MGAVVITLLPGVDVFRASDFWELHIIIDALPNMGASTIMGFHLEVMT